MSSSTSRPMRAVRPSGKLNKDNIAELELPSHRKFVETALCLHKLLHFLRNCHHLSRHHQPSILSRLMRRGRLIPNLDPVTRVNADHASPTLQPPVMMHQLTTLNLLLPQHLNRKQNLPKRKKRRRKQCMVSLVCSLLCCFLWC